MPDSGGAPAPQELCNAYRIYGKLGAGGMGIVYKALDTRLGRPVALKFLPPQVSADERSRDAFLNEARATSALDHPNIGTIYGVEENERGQMFIVMAYYEGETLAQRIRRGPLPPSEAVPIAIQIARGLSEAHSRNIVHRDIKPSNVILTEKGVAKVIDFGLARVIQSASMTQSAGLAGTMAYVSPEQVEGKGVDHRTDLWSFGVVLYQMLTGRAAFQADSAPALLYSIAHAAPADPGPEVPPELQQIVFRALAKNPAERYQSAAEVINDLQAVTPETMSVPAPPPASSRDLDYYRNRASSPSTRSARRRTAWMVAVAVAVVLAGLTAAFYALRNRIAPGVFGASTQHVAVLPLTVLGSNAEDVALAEGLVESLTSKLSNLQVGKQSLWVVPASEVRRRKITDPVAAQKTLGANLVVTGTLQRDAQRIRLILNLIDSVKLRQVGSGEFEDRTGDFTAVQDSALAKLANLMNIPATRDMLRTTGASLVPAAYESYLKALGYLQRYDKPGNLDQAVSLLNKSLESDPKFALAYASLGESYLMMYRLQKDPRDLQRASASCTRALELNDSLALVRVTMGRIQDVSGNSALALQEFQKALDLEPHNPDALAGVASVYEKQGRIKDAEEIFKRAAALRPDYWDGYNKLGGFYHRQGRFSEAEQAYRRITELEPDNAAGHQNRAAALIELGRLPEAAAELERAVALAPGYPAYANLGQVYYRQGRYAEAAKATQQALKLNDRDFRLWVNLAYAYRWLNRDNDAVAAYRRALPGLAEFVKTHGDDAVSQARLAELNAYAGDRETALVHVDAALALAPADPDILQSCANALYALGDHTRALLLANKSVALGRTMAELKLDPEGRRILADPGYQRPTK